VYLRVFHFPIEKGIETAKENSRNRGKTGMKK
jgi:hypothetical protein